MPQRMRLAPQTGTAVPLQAGEFLTVVDPEGEQVADVYAVTASDARDGYSSGRTIDYNETIRLTVGHTLYSHRSTPLLEICVDTVGLHDVLLAPCSQRMFELLRGARGHASCLGNVATALQRFGVIADEVQATFNAFMNVAVGQDGRVTLGVPRSRAGDRITFRAVSPVIVAVTACASEHSNGGRCKPIEIETHRVPA